MCIHKFGPFSPIIIFDVKTWLSPEIKSLAGISGPLNYKFSVGNGKTGVFKLAWIVMEVTKQTLYYKIFLQ